MYDLDGTTIFGMDGVERLRMEGTWDASSLAEHLVESWIPYFECHKCGRWGHCPHAVPHPANPHRALDIRCGVAAKALTEFVQRTIVVMDERCTEDRQAFLDAAFHFFKFVYGSEIQTSAFQDNGMLDFYGDAVPLAFGLVVGLRTHLDEMSRLLRRFPEFRTSRGRVLLVEGESEKTFIMKLRESHLVSLMYFDVQSYGGANNLKKQRVHMLLDEYSRRGFEVYAQGDADGTHCRNIENLVSSSLIDADHTFVFKHDFESAIPPALLHGVLERMGEKPPPRLDFRRSLERATGSVIKVLSDTWSIEIARRKVEVAEVAADILNSTNWWADDTFMESELGQFLNFVQKI